MDEWGTKFVIGLLHLGEGISRIFEMNGLGFYSG